MRRSQYLERECILGHLKTIRVVLWGGQDTVRIIQCSRARFLEKEALFLVTIIVSMFAFSS